MTSTNEAVDALCARIGFLKPRVRAVGRVLTDAGMLPAGSPGKSPELELPHVVNLLIGSAVDVPLRAVPKAVAAFRALTPAGVPIDSLPEGLRHTAGVYLDALAELAAEGSHDVRRLRLEFVANWSELAVHQPDGAISRFVEAGAAASHWQHSGHRKSTTINGAAFADAVRDLFGAQAHGTV